MKTSADPDEAVFNRPVEIGRRLAYVVYLIGVVVSPLVFMIGIFTRHPVTLELGLLALGMTGICHAWLRGRGRLRTMTREFEAMFAAISPNQPSRIAHLVALLQEWDDLELQRGTPGFDPWAVQSIRRSIEALVTADPALDRLFRNHLNNSS